MNNIRYKKFGTTRSSKFLPTSIIRDCSYPADIVKQGDSVLLLGSHAPSITPTLAPEPKTAWNFYLKAPKWQKQIWGDAAITEAKIQEIEEHLLNDNINCAGDGSVK